MNTRLKQFLAAENITQAQFADTLKIVRASVSHVLSGRNNPSYDFIRAIMEHYPLLNMEWLMLGTGKMYKSASNESASFSPVHVPDVIEDHETGLLFAEEPPEEIEMTTEEVHPASNYIKTLADAVQQTVRQRKVSKVIILYDDGSYQEM